MASDLGLDGKYQVSKLPIQAIHCKANSHQSSLTPALGPGQWAMVGEGRGDQGPWGRWSWGVGQHLRWGGFLRGPERPRRGKSAPKPGQTNLPL